MLELRADPEHALQVGLVAWAAIVAGRYPDLALLFAIPNAGKRTRRERGRLLDEGLKAGVWDLMLPVPRRGYHGLWLETKVDEMVPRQGRFVRYRSTLTDAQLRWGRAMQAQGFACRVYRSLDEARQILTDYLEGPDSGPIVEPELEQEPRAAAPAGPRQRARHRKGPEGRDA